LHFYDFWHEATSRLFEPGLTIGHVPLVTARKDLNILNRCTQLR
jgi:hypothetical protein